MKVLMVAAEAVPFVKTGGLADVIGSLPKALVEHGVDVRVILPKYRDIPDEWRQQTVPVAEMTVQVGWRRCYAGVERLELDGITYYFIDNEMYFKRNGLYGYEDDGERFAFFCQAVLEAAAHLDWKPDFLHCHDWHTALVPVFLKAHYGDSGFHAQMKTVFTIHNLRYQGIYPYGVLSDLLNVGDEHFHVNGLEYYGNVNYLKGALNYSDFITTVSPSYAAEIQTPYYGEGLDGTLRYRRDRLIGIVNGLDYSSYDPISDLHLRVPFRNSLKKKRLNKTALQEELGLSVQEEVLMISIIARLVEQKGIDLIVRVLDELLREDAQLVVLGAGDDAYEKQLKDAAYFHERKLSVTLKFDEGLARRIYASSDLFLMPSKFEPCGIGQMIAMRYGAVPIVRETGGLADTVKPYNEFTGEGHGFSFSHYNAHDMLFTVRRALTLLKETMHRDRIAKNMAEHDLSWNVSAEKYAELYRSLRS